MNLKANTLCSLEEWFPLKYLNIEINGVTITQLKEITLQRSIDSLCGSFQMTLSDFSPHDYSGGLIKVKYGKKIIFTGYVDTPEISFDDSSHDLSLTGRDKTQDLVDCSYIGNHQFNGSQSLLSFADKLAKPFGIQVSSTLDQVPIIKDFVIEPGEGVFEALERAGKSHGVLFLTDGEGNLVLSKPKRKVGPTLREGYEIKAARSKLDSSARFSNYKIVAQDRDGKNLIAQAKNQSIERHRPKVIIADESFSQKDLDRRAEWENAVRESRAHQGQLVLDSWVSKEGELWEVGNLVKVSSKKLGFDAELRLISSVSFSYGEGGTSCSLGITSPDAYIPHPNIKSKKSNKDKELRRKFGWIN